jgi:gingipain R
MIEYERDINTSDTWLNNGMGIARNEGAGGGHFGEADYVHMNFIRDSLLNFTYDVVYQEYDGNVPGMTNTTAALISANINNGVSIINFCNHGSNTGWSVAGYSNTHVNQLTNVGKLPFIWSVACVNGNFVPVLCFAEAWLRATHDGQPTGAIGTMMSTINQLWQPPMTGQDEMVTILVEKRDHIKRTFGGLSINGSMKMIGSHGSGGIETHDTWTLFGDPTLMVRTDVPEEMIVSHNPTLFLGSTAFTVNCDVEDALVAISYEDAEGEVHLLATAIVEGGVANIVFDQPIVEPLDLTVAITAFNKVTYLGELMAVPADEPYIVLDAFSTTAAPNYGQTIGINVVLKNIS